MSFFRSRIFIACVASTMTALVVGGVAWAAQGPVNGDGVIHACYSPTSGAMHLNVTGSCPTSGQKTPITWNAVGQRGPKGNAGPPGPAGATVAHISLTAPDVPGCGPVTGDYGDPSWFFPVAEDPTGATTGCFTTESPLVVSQWSSEFDPSQYPSDATITMHWWQTNFNTGTTTVNACVRVYDFDAHAPVVGTTNCLSGQSMTSPQIAEFTSVPITLTPGVHHLVLQTSWNFPNDGSGIFRVDHPELVVTW